MAEFICLSFSRRFVIKNLILFLFCRIVKQQSVVINKTFGKSWKCINHILTRINWPSHLELYLLRVEKIVDWRCSWHSYNLSKRFGWLIRNLINTSKLLKQLPCLFLSQTRNGLESFTHFLLFCTWYNSTTLFSTFNILWNNTKLKRIFSSFWWIRSINQLKYHLRYLTINIFGYWNKWQAKLNDTKILYVIEVSLRVSQPSAYYNRIWNKIDTKLTKNMPWYINNIHSSYHLTLYFNFIFQPEDFLAL